MAFEDYKADMIRCERCSYCKFTPWIKLDPDFPTVCPSISRYHFQSYSVLGRYVTARAFLDKRIDYSDTLLDVIYKCQMDGACDVTCKANRDLEPLLMMLDWRIKCVEEGELLPAHMSYIEGLRKEDNMMQKSKEERGDWAEGLGLKDLNNEKAEVVFHAGCRLSFDEELRKVTRGAVTLLKNLGVDFGIFGKMEVCCGGRPYELGYQGELIKYMDHNIEAWGNAGVKTVVTACSDCYTAFKVWYSRFGHNEFEILHITEYLARMIKEGKIKFTKEVPMTVTYHDPCHLGRLSEPWVPWEGKEKKVLGQLVLQDPPKTWRRGENGVYEPPRDILKSIPGIKLVEMPRIKEYAWCCGSGGGVKEAYPDFATWTAGERIDEAKSTGAEALVTACPWCERNFIDTISERGEKMKVYDIVELLQEAI